MVSLVVDLIALGRLLAIMISPACVRPNADAKNSVARGEKSDGVCGSSDMARSIREDEKTRRAVVPPAS